MNRNQIEDAAACLGAQIVKARRSRKLTQRSLATSVGMSRVTLANLETGRGTVAALVALLAALAHRFTAQPANLELGPWIAQSRKRLGLSQERLSVQAGVSKPAIVRIERGEGTIATLVAAMVMLGVSPSLTDVAIEIDPPPSPAPTARLLHGDCRNHMQHFIEGSVLFDAIVTDPPYHLAPISRRFGRKQAASLTGGDPGSDNPYRTMATGFMGQEWDGNGIAFDVETWRAAYDVLKPGGHLVAFGGPRTFHRLTVAVEDAGFEIRDLIMWIFASGFPKSHNVGRGIEGLKRGNARYSGREMPSDQSRLPPGELLREMAKGEWTGRVVRVDDRAAQRWQGHGTALKPGYEPILIARKPLRESSVAANVLKFGTGGINIEACRVPSDEAIEIGRARRKFGSSVALEGGGLPATFGEKVTHSNGRWPANLILGGIDESWSRYFYCPKASKSDRGAENNHPTVKPNDLMKYLVRLVTPPGGVVFDPFMGSGSTGVAAIQQGYRFVGVERMTDYVEIARRRVRAVGKLVSVEPEPDRSPEAA